MNTKTKIASLLALAALPLAALAGPTSTVPLRAHVYSQIVDEQNTNAYYGAVGEYCDGRNEVIDQANLMPDLGAGPSTAWDIFLSGWSTATGLDSATYEDGTNCSSASACLRAEFQSNAKNMSLDTRVTAPARTFTLDFTAPYNPAVNVPGFGSGITTTGLLEVLGRSSHLNMQVCSSAACPEAKLWFAKFWFVDPADRNVMWRVDWRFMRVLRVATNKWYFIADACDGSQVAGLSKLEGSRTRPKETFNGQYLVPFFVVVETK